jgi:hypothetical protein
MAAADSGESETLPLSKAATLLLEECRMVLPGIQALLGFQLVSVYNAGFGEKLAKPEQVAHLVAVGLLALAAALVMAPAAYHRETDPRAISSAFIRLSTRLLLGSMVALGLAVSIDVYLIARIILDDVAIAAGLAGALLATMGALWFVYPRVRRARG